MNLDVIVITRGGGSYEDLSGFSSKQVVKTIYNANTCIISAIGHEKDHMLSDYVSDIRAPTPSIAGEIICDHQKKLSGTLLGNICTRQMQEYIQDCKDITNDLEKKIMSRHDIIKKCLTNLDKIKNDTKSVLCNTVHKLYTRADYLKRRYSYTDPIKVLKQGYAIIYGDIRKNKQLKIRLSSGYITVSINSLNITNTNNGNK